MELGIRGTHNFEQRRGICLMMNIHQDLCCEPKHCVLTGKQLKFC